MRLPIIVLLLLATQAIAADDVPKAKLGDPDSMQPLTPKAVKSCKRIVQETTGNEVKELIQRNGEFNLPITPKFMAIEFKHKENILYCYAAKAAEFKGFKPIKLIYFTNYKDYGSYNPATGLIVRF